MTESARKDIVRNGVAPGPTEVVGGRVAGAAPLDDLGERCVGEETGHRESELGDDVETVDRDDSPSQLREAFDCERQLTVGHADDDEVVRVVRDARRERTTLQPRARHEAESHPAGCEVPFDDRDLREVVLGARDRVPAFHDGLAFDRLGYDLIVDETDRAHRPSAPRDCEVRRRDRRDPDGLAHPLGNLHGRYVLDRPPVLQHRRGLEAHEVGEEQEVGDVPRARSRRGWRGRARRRDGAMP